MNVYLLVQCETIENGERVTVLGAYSTEENAVAAMVVELKDRSEIFPKIIPALCPNGTWDWRKVEGIIEELFPFPGGARLSEEALARVLAQRNDLRDYLHMYFITRGMAVDVSGRGVCLWQPTSDSNYVMG